MKDRRLKMDHITLGVCYYPEHWPEDMWQADLQEMKRCGIEVIRIAEFAWNKFEPQEGVYTFDFFRPLYGSGGKEGHESDLLYPDRHAAAVADGEVSGSSQCGSGW